MRTNKEVSKLFFEKIKWLVITILLVAAVIFNNYYINFSFTIRAIFIFFIIFISCIIALITNIVKYTLVFAREAHTEVCKVIWPTLKENFNTTLIIIIVTAVMSITLWGLDSIILYVVSCITSIRL